MATYGDDEGRSAERIGDLGGFDAPVLPPPAAPPATLGPPSTGFAPPVVPPPLVSAAPPLYATSTSRTPEPVRTLPRPIGTSASGGPASFEEIRAVHEATTRQLRERREPTTGRGAMLAVGLVTTIGAMAILFGALWF